MSNSDYVIRKTFHLNLIEEIDMKSLIITKPNIQRTLPKKHLQLVLNCAVTLFITIGASVPSLAAKCNDVTFRNHNTSSNNLVISRVRFKDENSGDQNAWRTHNLRDYTCASHSDCVSISPEDLGYRENHNLVDFEFEIVWPWGTTQWSAPNTDVDSLCVDDRQYPNTGAFDVP